jgi:hypothetical protein
MSCNLTTSERSTQRSCNDRVYLRNVVENLNRAIAEKDIDEILTYATELERYKVICGDSPVIEQLERGIKRAHEELGLNDAEIIRALDTVACKTCTRCNCIEKTQQQPMGFRAMLDAAFGNEAVETHPTIQRRQGYGFRAMLDAATKRDE